MIAELQFSQKMSGEEYLQWETKQHFAMNISLTQNYLHCHSDWSDSGKKNLATVHVQFILFDCLLGLMELEGG